LIDEERRGVGGRGFDPGETIGGAPLDVAGFYHGAIPGDDAAATVVDVEVEAVEHAGAAAVDAVAVEIGEGGVGDFGVVGAGDGDDDAGVARADAADREAFHVDGDAARLGGDEDGALVGRDRDVAREVVRAGLGDDVEIVGVAAEGLDGCAGFDVLEGAAGGL